MSKRGGKPMARAVNHRRKKIAFQLRGACGNKALSLRVGVRSMAAAPAATDLEGATDKRPRREIGYYSQRPDIAFRCRPQTGRAEICEPKRPSTGSSEWKNLQICAGPIQGRYDQGFPSGCPPRGSIRVKTRSFRRRCQA